MKITRNQDAGPMAPLAKRFYVPFTVTSECPQCGSECEVDLEHQYLSYPVIGRASRVYFVCECEHEWQENIVVDVTLAAEGQALR